MKRVIEDWSLPHESDPTLAEVIAALAVLLALIAAVLAWGFIGVAVS